MDELEKRNTGDFSLEDILKEFADQPAAPEEDDVVIWDGNIPTEPRAKTREELSDTVRLDDVTKVLQELQQPATEETVRFTLPEDTMRFSLPF